VPRTRSLASLALASSCALVALAAGAWTARADVVDPPPASCPPGSTPSTGHSGPYCAPTPECTATSCSGGASCLAVAQCIETRDCGGLRPPDSGPCTIEHVAGACGAGGSCAVGTCRARSVCTTGGGATTSGGCGCAVVGAGSTHGASLALALAALGVLAASRRRAVRARAARR
jgi:hypothetical protein